MGDNRDQFGRQPLRAGSKAGWWDRCRGRIWAVRAEFITFSLDGTTQLWNPLTWFTALRPGRIGRSLHPDQSE
jgi:signal peptidase I